MTSASGPKDRQRKITAAFLGYRSFLERIVSRILKGADANVQDVVQDTFLRCYEAASEQDIRFPKSFLTRTATNLALNRLQCADYRLVDHVEDIEALDVYLGDDPSHNPVETLCADRQRFLDFCNAVGALPAKCRHAFLLKKVYGLSQGEIARTLRVSESTVEKHVAKGLLLCMDYMNRKAGGKDST